MKDEYREWIERHGSTYRRCAETTLEMCATFSDLRRVGGHVVEHGYTTAEGHQQPHWWCVDPNGEIVDPTAGQFAGVLDYVARDEHQPEPTGKCIACGGACYGYRAVCSDECSAVMARECEGEWHELHMWRS